jgi:hypothetical protein
MRMKDRLKQEDAEEQRKVTYLPPFPLRPPVQNCRPP